VCRLDLKTQKGTIIDPLLTVQMSFFMSRSGEAVLCASDAALEESTEKGMGGGADNLDRG
jgi:hypothetical protein